MARSKKTPQTKRPAGRNQGEGDRDSARRFNEAERAFVDSERGRAAIRSRESEHVSEDEEDLREAEADAASRARENDPEEMRDHRKPAH